MDANRFDASSRRWEQRRPPRWGTLRNGGISLALVLALAAAFAASDVRADDPPTCPDALTQTDRTATKWLTTPGTLVGTSGDDVLVGSTGSDIILGRGGNDTICGFPDERGEHAPDQVDGGSGSDSIIAAGIVEGGSGDDYVTAIQEGSLAKGGSGNDTVVAAFGATGDGGSGNDEVIGGVLGSLALYGGSGNDTIVNTWGPGTTIDCGSGRDRVFANGATDVRRCEDAFVP